MDELIGICGLACSECSAYIATMTDDKDLRIETAETWTKMFNANIKPAQINCEGCTSDGDTHFTYCKVCEIRSCGVQRGVENCALCDAYICEKLDKFFQMAPDAKTRLDKVKQALV
jgi:hypothetical protein